ncbi:Ion transport 2 [Penicillium sp. DV-2018c]|nr:Ion transport 2 [Penicillium sp. DV-2018c]KAJ5563401.1 Ion transport 2 [Penicillium sp. DV-2018c]
MQHETTPVEMSNDVDSAGLSVRKRLRSRFNMRPPEDDEPQSWWIASTAIPLIAAATGPLANVMSIVALVDRWRDTIISRTEGPAGNLVQEGNPDPQWVTALNAVSLACGIVGNAFLLFNFTHFVRYIIALPVTIILWFMATGILGGLLLATNIYVPPTGENQLYSEAYWSAVIAAILYFILSFVLMINMFGYFLGKYPQHFSLTDEQRTLILQMIALVCWLLIGAVIFQHAIEISFADALYFSDVTVLTMGFGDILPTSNVARGVLMPYAIIGFTILALVVGSTHRFAHEVHYDNVIRKHMEHKRRATVKHSISLGQYGFQGKHLSNGSEISAPTLGRQISPQSQRHGPFRNIIDAITPNRRPKLHVMREEKDRFNAMRCIQHDTMRFRRWNNLIISIIAFGIIWSCGAIVFWALETDMTYFESLYFCFTSLTTLGYGDFTPKSNPSRPFFVVWSLTAIPIITMLISHMSDTIVVRFKQGTELVADYLILPQAHLYKSLLARIPGLARFTHPRQREQRTEQGFSIEGADDANTDSVEAGQLNHSDSVTESHLRESLEELARDPSPLELAQCLAFAIRRVTAHSREKERKYYSYEEWAEFTRLIQFTDAQCRRCRQSASQGDHPANEGGRDNIEEDEYGIVSWDWIGEDSPLLSKQTESEWVLDRLCESLIRYMSILESETGGGGAESGEEATHREEKDIGLGG